MRVSEYIRKTNQNQRMAASIPRPSTSGRPSYGPPTTALPALPKTRKSTGMVPTVSSLQATSGKSGLRAPSSPNLPSLPTTPGGSTALPKLRTTPGVNGAGKTLRKTISINAFPQPPRGGLASPGFGIRTSSLPPSPLSVGLTPSSARTKQESEHTGTPATPRPKKAKRARPSVSPNRMVTPKSYVGNATPSLLNGSGDSRSISSGPGGRGSDGLLSLPSPPQSRSSSAQDSYSTSGKKYKVPTHWCSGS